jgi:uncharacterized protein
MGRPVVHFEVMGKDGEKLRSLYAELFHWVIDADNPLGYVEAALARAEQLGGTRLMGPSEVQPGIGLHFSDPEGHMVGVVKAPA